ncbi:FHA domain-containing protein [Thalassoroseus pseudoceratinae]|uniref:FHA domain-containing protein n=1 Tax=Thalassoroseus pseudoceratinae TaxID=2713176 RepID=UPI00141FBBF5|nr:FHA domain-containing protein [Thalassoroseus pseudoceratinae]
MASCPYCSAALSEDATQCPKCRAELLNEQTYQPTRRAPERSTKKPKEDGEDSALAFRPINRPPTLLLCAIDDGSRDDGEWFRVRKPKFQIGRIEGDIVIGHDNGISGRHLEIVQKHEDGRFRFHMRDLGSRNGTFVRVSKAVLKNKQELLIGAKRYYFSGASREKRNWESGRDAALADVPATLVEMTPRGDGDRYVLNDGDNYLGTNPDKCSVAIMDDPFVSTVHARVFCDDRGRWLIENRNSLNGVWIRITDMPLDTGGEFQIGEQRFLVRIP